MLGNTHSVKSRKILSEKAKKEWNNPDIANKLREDRKIFFKLNPDLVEKNSIAHKNLWKDKNSVYHSKEYREKQIRASLKGLFQRPTSLECKMMVLIHKYDLPYQYTGDGRFLIGYKNPDFINVNGEKICVEVANTIHHNEMYPEERIKHFAKWGWKCIVFRCNELDENEVVEKLKNG